MYILDNNLNFLEKIKISFFLLFLSFILFGILHFIPDNSPTLISPISKNIDKKEYEVFGFAPYWNIDKLDNINFNVLTTLAYFDLPVNSSGYIDGQSPGYQSFLSDSATQLFKKAHTNGTRVVATLTQMDNYSITSLMDNPSAQEGLINDTTSLVKKRGIDGVNIDFEYFGDPGDEYRNKFSYFVSNFANVMHKKVPGSKVTVSVYASAIKDPKIYDIGSLASTADGIFMMAYDFAVASSQNAIPTSPLYGHKEGQYWYDVSSAVADFLTVMPSKKLILGLPWYGYNYPVYNPKVMAQTAQGYWLNSWPQTYSDANQIGSALTGWDDLGKVSWKAYAANGVWRMIFMEDPKSLKIKYDFAKQKKLAGVGMWAMGNDYGKTELWDLLANEFGSKLVNNQIIDKKINDTV